MSRDSMPNKAKGEAFHAADCDICLSVRDRHFDLVRKSSTWLTRTHESWPPMRSRASEPRGLLQPSPWAMQLGPWEPSPPGDAARVVGA